MKYKVMFTSSCVRRKMTFQKIKKCVSRHVVMCLYPSTIPQAQRIAKKNI